VGRACHSLRGSFHWWNRLRGFCMFFHARSTGIPRTAAAAASPLPLPRQSWRHLPLSVSCRHRAAVAPAAAVSPAPPRLDPAGRQRGPRPDDWAGRRPRGAALPGRHAPVPPPPAPPFAVGLPPTALPAVGGDSSPRPDRASALRAPPPVAPPALPPDRGWSARCRGGRGAVDHQPVCWAPRQRGGRCGCPVAGWRRAGASLTVQAGTRRCRGRRRGLGGWWRHPPRFGRAADGCVLPPAVRPVRAPCRSLC